MKAFIDLTARPGEGKEVLHGTHTYLEWQTHSVDPPGISYTYVTPLDRSSFVTSVCWEHEFDRFAEFIFHPQLSIDWVHAYGEMWPAFGELLTNAMGNRYSAPSLVNFVDPDDGDRKWHVACFVSGTVPTDEYAQVADDPRVRAAAQGVVGKSIELLEQMSSDRQISGRTKLKLMGKSTLAGHATPSYNDSVWLSDMSRLASR
jgi:hypothetical protein